MASPKRARTSRGTSKTPESKVKTPKSKGKNPSPRSSPTRERSESSSSSKRRGRDNSNPSDSISTSEKSPDPPSNVIVTRRARSMSQVSETSTGSHTKTGKKDKMSPRKKSPKTSATKSTKSKSTSMVPVSPSPSTTSPLLDVSVHRMRLWMYQPAAILATAALNSDDGATSFVGSLLAVSRQDGSVELRDAQSKLRVLGTVPGYQHRPVTTMAWIKISPAEDSTSPAAISTVTSPDSFSADRILVGASPDGTMFIIDFTTGQQIAVTASGGGGVFCLESFPDVIPSPSSADALLAVGCEDGVIRIFHVTQPKNTTMSSSSSSSFTSDPKFVLVSSTPSAGAAILSLSHALVSSSSSSDRHRHSPALFAGIADGTIRRFDRGYMERDTRTDPEQTMLSSSSTLWKSTMRMTLPVLGRNTATRVWALEALSDGTLVSGDSLGNVSFWDGHTGVLEQTFCQNENKADVLDLAVTANECRVFCSGVDSRVVCIERPELDAPRDHHLGAIIPTTTTDEKDVTMEDSSSTFDPRRWIMSHAQRPHTHDVKAVTIYQIKSNQNNATVDTSSYHEILCTGGVDTKLCTYSVNKFQKTRPRTIYPWPHMSPISLATEGRILAMQRPDRVDVYRLGDRLSEHPSNESSPTLVPDEDKLIGTIEVNSRRNLVCTALSVDGEIMFLSDGQASLLFDLMPDSEDGGAKIWKPRTIPLKLPARSSIVSARFTTRSLLLLVDSTGSVHSIGITKDDEQANNRVERQARFLQTIKPPKEDKPSRFMCHPSYSAVSADGAWFAYLRKGQGSQGKIQIFHDSDGVYQHWWTLPDLDNGPCALAFIVQTTAARAAGASGYHVAVSCVDFSTYLFDLENRCLSEWSRNAGHPVSKRLPNELRYRKDYPVRMCSSQTDPTKLLVGSFGAFVAFDLSKAFPTQCRTFPEKHVRTRKRRRAMSISEQSVDNDSVVGEESSCVLCLRYNSMLQLEFVGDNELLVAEQPWLGVVAGFPEALHRRVYGS